MNPIARRLALVAGFVAAIALASGCRSHPSAQASTGQPPTSPAPVDHPAFNSDRAWSYLTAQCALGPRVPDTTAHEKCRQLILDDLTPNVDRVETQTFTYRDTNRHKRLLLTNIIGIINPKATRRVMLLTHWDTRPTADQELDEVNKEKPIPGADDGASGTAVLLELAHTFHEKRPDIGVELLFVDGEDWGPGDPQMYLGARYFAAHPGPNRPDYAILLDMIGDKNLQIHREHYSEEHNPDIDNKVWNAARDLGYAAEFPNDTKYEITDDHQPLNDAGIPAIDLIDFDYPYWHMLSDTPDKCSPQSLKIVGETVARVVYLEKP